MINKENVLAHLAAKKGREMRKEVKNYVRVEKAKKAPSSILL